MPGPPALAIAPRASTGKRKRSEQGWAHRKACDAQRTAEHYEGRDALVRPHYTLGTIDEKQLQIHLDPVVRVRKGLVQEVPWMVGARTLRSVAGSGRCSASHQQAARQPLVAGSLANPTRGAPGQPRLS